MAFSIFTDLCNRRYNLILGHFRYLRKKISNHQHSFPISPHPTTPIPNLQPQTITNLLSVFIELPSLDISYKWDHSLCDLLQPASFTQHTVLRSIHVIFHSSVLHSFSLSHNILLYSYIETSHFVYSFISCQKFGLFPLWGF